MGRSSPGRLSHRRWRLLGSFLYSIAVFINLKDNVTVDLLHFPISMHLSTLQIVEVSILTLTTTYHTIATHQEKSQFSPPGTITNNIHWYSQGNGHIILIDHSLGGVEGYLLIDELAKLGRVVIFDRPGYGWSSNSQHPRTSQQINIELQNLLQIADIQPPYILIGDSFGSYNMRLFAHQDPSQVTGLIMTDGLHEKQMLSLPFRLQILKIFFAISFVFVSIGATLGIVRLVGSLGLFELIKPELRQCDRTRLRQVKQSFYRNSHWWTMAREMIRLDTSGQQLRGANDLGDIPVVNIKAHTFLRMPGPHILWSWLTEPADRARDNIHLALAKISSNSQQIAADKSSHFVWVDEPETIVAAIQIILKQQPTP
jgi:pimeloyl-ACP methyl ester carboxylesterase